MVPEGLVGGDNTTELAKNLTSDMDNITLANLPSLPNSLGSNLTTLVVMVPRVCPTALRKSHWYTRQVTPFHFRLRDSSISSQSFYLAYYNSTELTDLRHLFR